MADYISTLTGAQMDASLLDMAEHTSEAYAVGERNGVAVGSDDVTYHNNARYYAQQAQSIAPASVTEAVRWDVAQTALTDANKEMARSNIDAGKNGAWTNPNLLDNPFFTINQRSVNGTITNGQYGLDRWMAGGGTVTMTTGGITLGAGNSYALQRPANKEIFNGKTVTMSVMTDDGVIESGTVVAQTGAAKSVRTANFELCIGYTAYGSFYFYNTSSSVKTVIAAKLELGSVSTLANDAPPDYGTELAKCQRYFFRLKSNAIMALGFGTMSDTTTARITFPTPVPLRASPSVSCNAIGTIRVVGNNGASTPSAVSIRAYSTNGVAVAFTVSPAITDLTVVMAQMNDANTYIDLSADL